MYWDSPQVKGQGRGRRSSLEPYGLQSQVLSVAGGRRPLAERTNQTQNSRGCGSTVIKHSSDSHAQSAQRPPSQQLRANLVGSTEGSFRFTSPSPARPPLLPASLVVREQPMRSPTQLPPPAPSTSKSNPPSPRPQPFGAPAATTGGFGAPAAFGALAASAGAFGAPAASAGAFGAPAASAGAFG
eukprot:CAMPEP_0114175674 /NCGR_PEP_ID=MMETSP0043_2-20121206/37086_1 /TAXON_ID=464988 /ORGANISM="Hemiselmis andersenii, Strain CCMP644" /LENGTH=184 /DNA_ID=CAMNT_0001273935 /DNA_START=136 /DNA_END=687 /DNA_ORIENTATION=+